MSIDFSLLVREVKGRRVPCYKSVRVILLQTEMLVKEVRILDHPGSSQLTCRSLDECCNCTSVFLDSQVATA